MRWLIYPLDHIHTCEKFQKDIREIFLSFQEGLSKCTEYAGKVLDSDEQDFEILVESGMFWKKFQGSFQGASLKIREGSHI